MPLFQDIYIKFLAHTQVSSSTNEADSDEEVDGTLKEINAVKEVEVAMQDDDCKSDVKLEEFSEAGGERQSLSGSMCLE